MMRRVFPGHEGHDVVSFTAGVSDERGRTIASGVGVECLTCRGLAPTFPFGVIPCVLVKPVLRPVR